MKNIIFIAVFTVSGLVFVSCDSEAIENTTPQFKEMSIQKESYNSMTLREDDSIPITEATTNPEDGPGDDVIPIKPPKP